MNDLVAERVEVVGLDHVYLAVTDLERSEKFYDTVLALLDFRKIDAAIGGEPHRHYFNKVMQISIRPAHGGKHDPYAPGLHHLCLRARSREDVDRCAAAVKEIGGTVAKHISNLMPSGSSNRTE